jgi:hypothetical protein
MRELIFLDYLIKLEENKRAVDTSERKSEVRSRPNVE